MVVALFACFQRLKPVFILKRRSYPNEPVLYKNAFKVTQILIFPRHQIYTGYLCQYLFMNTRPIKTY